MAQPRKPQSIVHLGKQGLSDNFFQTLESHFKTRENVKVILLPSARKNKQEARAIAAEIETKLGKNFTAHLIGYTLNVKKWRKPVR